MLVPSWRYLGALGRKSLQWVGTILALCWALLAKELALDGLVGYAKRKEFPTVLLGCLFGSQGLRG